jgi:hypothetical protein
MTIPDAWAKDYCLLLSHSINNPSEVWELPTLNPMAEHMKEKLDFWSPIRLLHNVVVSKWKLLPQESRRWALSTASTHTRLQNTKLLISFSKCLDINLRQQEKDS